jgi:hypothetical protein
MLPFQFRRFYGKDKMKTCLPKQGTVNRGEIRNERQKCLKNPELDIYALTHGIAHGTDNERNR